LRSTCHRCLRRHPFTRYADFARKTLLEEGADAFTKAEEEMEGKRKETPVKPGARNPRCIFRVKDGNRSPAVLLLKVLVFRSVPFAQPR
jgi:hypothetical protein